MSDKIFKPVADVFALIHAGGEPYQWTQDAILAAEWLRDNPNYSVKEFVSLERYQAAVTDDLSALQQKLDAVLAENARMLSDYREIPEMRRIGAPLTPATDAILNEVRAEGANAVAEYHKERFEFLANTCREASGEHKAAYLCALDVAAQLRSGSNEGGVCDGNH